MQHKLSLILAFYFISFFKIHCIKIDRVILATDKNPNYIEFWPIVAKAWKDLIGAKPTIALIADKSIKIDESCGEVIRFEPIVGIESALYAQTIRLLLPAYFENEVCIISDIDMIPLNKKFFCDNLKTIADDCFVLCQSNIYDKPHLNKFPICYNIAKGKLFKEIFFINHLYEIPNIIKYWSKFNMGPNTDEIVLYKYLMHWKNFNTKFKKINYKYEQRIERETWNFYKIIARSIKENKKDFIIDIHCQMPYSKHKQDIDLFINLFK